MVAALFLQWRTFNVFDAFQFHISVQFDAFQFPSTVHGDIDGILGYPSKGDQAAK